MNGHFEKKLILRELTEMIFQVGAIEARKVIKQMYIPPQKLTILKPKAMEVWKVMCLEKVV